MTKPRNMDNVNIVIVKEDNRKHTKKTAANSNAVIINVIDVDIVIIIVKEDDRHPTKKQQQQRGQHHRATIDQGEEPRWKHQRDGLCHTMKREKQHKHVRYWCRGEVRHDN